MVKGQNRIHIALQLKAEVPWKSLASENCHDREISMEMSRARTSSSPGGMIGTLAQRAAEGAALAILMTSHDTFFTGVGPKRC